VALSFDDVRSTWTPKAWTFFKEKNAKATFLMIASSTGQCEPDENESWLRAMRSGITTWTHPGHQRDFSPPIGLGTELHRTVVWQQAGSSRFSSGLPTRSIRSRIPRPGGSRPISSRRWVTPSSATRSIPATGTSARGRPAGHPGRRARAVPDHETNAQFRGQASSCCMTAAAEPQRDHRDPAGADRRATRARLRRRAGLRPHG